MDINKLVKDITNVFNGNTNSIKRKKYDDDLNDGIKYLSNKEKRLKHLENRIQMISGNNVEGMENIDYVGKGHTRVKILNDIDNEFLDEISNNYDGHLNTYKNEMSTFMGKYQTIINQVETCNKNCAENSLGDACKAGCKLRSPILHGTAEECIDKYNQSNSADFRACNLAYNGTYDDKQIDNNLKDEYSSLNSHNENLKTDATKLFNRIAALRQQNNSLIQKTYNAEASMGRPPDPSGNDEDPYPGKGKMKEFHNIKAQLRPGSNPNSSLTPAQIILRIMEKDSIARVDSITLRTYLWVAGTIGIVGGTIYYINKNSD